ncbi:MAG: hypothetical protein KA998_03140, partial [Rickettsiaceae bacterium]|nr:hypothetical protein [Rickettsiaceae bacterium]
MPKSPKNTIAQLKAKEFELHRLFQSNTEIAPQTLIEYLNKFCDSEYNVSPGIAASINNYF